MSTLALKRKRLLLQRRNLRDRLQRYRDERRNATYHTVRLQAVPESVQWRLAEAAVDVAEAVDRLGGRLP